MIMTLFIKSYKCDELLFDDVTGGWKTKENYIIYYLTLYIYLHIYKIKKILKKNNFYFNILKLCKLFYEVKICHSLYVLFYYA